MIGPRRRDSSISSALRCTLWVPSTTSTYGALARTRSRSFWARQPATTIWRSRPRPTDLLPALELAEVAVQLVVGVLSDAAGVEDHDVGVVHRSRQDQPVALEQSGDALGVVLVHLAPERPDHVAAGAHRRSQDRGSTLTRCRPHPRRHASSMGSSSAGVNGDRLLRGVAEAGLLEDPVRDLHHDLGVLGQEDLGVLPTLAELLAVVGEPGSRLLHDPQVDGQVQQRAFTADPLAVHDVELGLAERRRHLVLHHLDPGAVAHHLGAVLDGLDAADVQPDRRVELQRPPTRGGLR